MDESQLPEDTMKVVFPYGIPVLLVKKFDQVYAISNRCAHMGCTLSRGSLWGLAIKCPCHEWMFDIRTGEFLNVNQVKIPTYESKVEESKIFVKI